jgi:hypothetical protein
MIAKVVHVAAPLTRMVAWVAAGISFAVALAAVTSASQSPTPATKVIGPVTGGAKGHPFRSFAVANLDLLTAAGYVEEEFFLEGSARAYEATAPLSRDGVWSVLPASTAAYRTRLLVRRPAAASRFNGTVFVEWLNVTAGFDLDPDFAYGSMELLRGGYAWIGVSAQAAGVNGGTPPGFGLKSWDPERYGTLVHPGDSFSYDIFTQTGLAVRASGTILLGPLRARRVIADGESQSAGRMVTYVNAVHPSARVFDGVLIHSRSSRSAPLSQAPLTEVATPNPALIRADLDTPVLVVQSETDVPGALDARQPDSPTFRQWEIAGTAHVDRYMADVSDPITRRDLPTFPGFPCDKPYNDGPHHWVFQAALRALDGWIASGVPPPSAQPIETRPGPPAAVTRDAHGNALGGIRTPHVDVPVATLSGTGNTPGFCALFGTTTPFERAALDALYPNHSFSSRFGQSADDAVKAGFMLQADAAAVKAQAANAASRTDR